MIYLYQILGFILIPIIKINLQLRIKQKKELNERYKERFGYSKITPNKKNKLIWIHAASMGEFKSSDFLINKFCNSYTILVTTTTVSAANYAKKYYGNKIIHQFAPLDISFWINKFLDNWKPSLVIWIESDLWPLTMYAIKKRNINAILINLRMSPKSYNKWKWFPIFYKNILKCFSEIYAQSENDKIRITSLTKRDIKFIGNLKLATLNINNKEIFYEDSKENKKFINLMIVSSHKNEEKKILPIIKKLIHTYSNVRVSIAPRHPDRALEIASICNTIKMSAQLEKENSNNQKDIFIINSFGNLEKYFATCDIAFMGGSLTNNGGHNPIEPAIYKCAIITGPYVFNWQNIYEEMINQNSCIKVNSAKDLKNNLENLIKFKEKIENLKINAYKYAQKQFFDTKILVNTIENIIKTKEC